MKKLEQRQSQGPLSARIGRISCGRTKSGHDGPEVQDTEIGDRSPMFIARTKQPGCNSQSGCMDSRTIGLTDISRRGQCWKTQSLGEISYKTLAYRPLEMTSLTRSPTRLL